LEEISSAVGASAIARRQPCFDGRGAAERRPRRRCASLGKGRSAV